MRRKRAVLFGLVTALVAVAALTVGLTAGVGQVKPTRGLSPQAGYKIYFIPKATSIPVFTQNGLGAKEAAKKLGDTVTYNGPTDVDGPKQVPFIDTAAAQGYNAIVISTPDPAAVAPALKRASQKGVKVVSYNGDTTRDARTIFVAPTTNKGIGAFQVRWLAQQINYTGQFAILSATPTSGNQNTWIKFMKQELQKKQYNKMKLVKIAYGNDNPTDSAKQTQSLLQAYPKLKGII